MHPYNNFGLWTVIKKLEECVTLHSNFLEMSYELNIKMKCMAPLHLGDVKNLLIPPRNACYRQLKLVILVKYVCIKIGTIIRMKNNI